MIYRQGLPYLDYSPDVLISWIQQLGLYNWFCLQLYTTYWLDVTLQFCTSPNFINYFTVHCLPAWLEYTTPWSCTHVFVYARLTFILRTRWVAFLTTPGPACPDLKAWSVVDFHGDSWRSGSVVILLLLVLYPWLLLVLYPWPTPELSFTVRVHTILNSVNPFVNHTFLLYSDVIFM